MRQLYFLSRNKSRGLSCKGEKSPGHPEERSDVRAKSELKNTTPHLEKIHLNSYITS